MVVSNALRRILVATDFSPGAAAAVDRAVQLARAHGAALDLLHVFDVGAWHSLKGVFDAQRLTVDPPPDVATRQRLSDLAATLAADAGLQVEAHFSVGEAAERIVAHARERGCALVVVGARADPGWLGLGGTASKVVRAPGCPVLTLRLNAARLQASDKLLEAAHKLAQAPQAMQLRYLQTLTAIAGEKISTIVFPMPVDLLSSILGRAPESPGQGGQSGPSACSV